MAPNLIELGLRRLNIDNQSFLDLVYHTKKVEKLDISECQLIQSSGMIKFLENSGKSLKHLEASNCQDAITDQTLAHFTTMENESLNYLDISYSKLVTDEGLQHFEGKTYPLTCLNLTGLTGVTGKGLYYPIFACKETLLHFQGALMDQEEMKIPEFGKALGQCWNIESIDLGYGKHITDEFFMHLTG